ncbi:hypothetical protein NHQ30_005469 [Ciborinia camelliae]|nr:hypothetical protein NHQ30_005469 [Ciborinia camelliae]
MDLNKSPPGTRPPTMGGINGQSSKGAARSSFPNGCDTPSKAYSDPTLKGIPLELRRHIWKYLLVNPDLGKALSIQKKDRYGSQAKYGLAPVILCVCKQFHREGMPILYEENQFLIEFFGIFWYRKCRHSALTRYWERVDCLFSFQTKKILEAVPVVKKVKHWKIVLSASQKEGYYCDFLQFCHFICHNQLKSVEVAIVPWGIGCNQIFNGDCSYEHEEYDHPPLPKPEEIHRILSPLNTLRNIGNVIIRGADLDEIPEFAICENNSRIKRKIILPDPIYHSELITLMQSNTEVEPFHQIYHAFLKYAQAFERIAQFRNEMTLISYKEEIQPLGNPFRDGGTFHPVEQALYDSANMVDESGEGKQDVPELKLFRLNALSFLERQYVRIQKAADDLVEFIKDQKKPDKLFSPAKLPSQHYRPEQDEALVLLQNYAESFARELTLGTKIAILRQGGSYEKRFENLPREIALRECIESYNNLNDKRFIANFKLAFDDMDAQYLEIQRARKELFQWDLKNPRSFTDVKIHYLRCDEKVEWDKVEPDMSVKLSKQYSPFARP